VKNSFSWLFTVREYLRMILQFVFKKRKTYKLQPFNELVYAGVAPSQVKETIFFFLIENKFFPKNYSQAQKKKYCPAFSSPPTLSIDPD
jgi:hypothetical protein